MKKLTLLFVFVFIVQAITFSQPCPDSLYITTQAQIDSFQINYPGCTEIEGDVDIGEWIAGTDISNLDGLIGLTSIGGSLKIHLNNLLTNLSGLDNVTSIGGNLEIMSNGNLTSLTGLDNLTSIGGGLEIWYCDALSNLMELNNVTSIGGYFGIWSCGGLTSLNGLGNVTSFGGAIVFYSNTALTSLSGLENVTSISGRIEIIQNYALANLTGLENVDANSIDSLLFRDNTSLTTCEVQSVCNYISTPGATIEIHDNANGCNSIAEVEEACDALGFLENNFRPEFSIYPNPATDKLHIASNNGLEIETVNIYNQLGQKVLHINEIGENIDISTLSKGIYIIELNSSELKIRQKLIIEE